MTLLRRITDHTPIVAWMVLVLSVLITVAAWKISTDALEKRNQARFEFQAQDLVTAIERRMKEYEMALRSGVGLFDAFGDVSRTDWQRFVANLNLQRNLPGIQGIGFSRLIRPEDKAAHEQRIQAEGFPGFTIRPEGDRPLYSSIDFLEPFDWRNQRAFGYDMYSEPVRKEAMERAMNSGKPALSGRVTLVQEVEVDRQYGFLMYLPVYRQGAPLNSEVQRREATIGFVYSPFRARDLMVGILGASQESMHYAIYDGDRVDSERVLVPFAHHHTPLLQTSRQLHIGGRHWTIEIIAAHGFVTTSESAQPLIVAVCGLIIDLLLFYVITMLARQRKTAMSRANDAFDLLRAEQQKMSEALQHLPIGVAVIDAKQNIRYSNPAIAALGIEQSNNNPTPLSEQNSPLSRLIQELLSSSLPIKQEFNITFDGEAHWLALSAGPVIETIDARIVSVQDVTEPKVNASNFQTIIDLAADSVWISDSDGHFLYANSAACALTGFTLRELRNMTIADLVADEDVRRIEPHLAELQRPGHSITARWRLQHERGGLVDVELTTQRLPDGRHLAIGRDIRGSIEQEQALVAARVTADRSNLEKSRFLASMSHEIRTPLNAILGMAQLLIMDSQEAEERHRHAESIYQAATHLLQLLNEVLEVSRIESGEIAVNRERVAPLALFEKTVSIFQDQAKRQGTELILESDIAANRHYQVDATKLRQIVSNLLSNAVKHTQHGKVTLRSKEERQGTRTFLCIDVTDTGCGIDAADLPQIFDCFYQASHSTLSSQPKSWNSGSGMGLFIVKRLCERLNGRIDVESERGKGTCFRVRLPVQRAGEYAVAEHGLTRLLEAPRDRSLRFLIAEDVMESRYVLERFIAKAGHESIAVENGAQLMQRVQTGEVHKHCDVILMDCQMPQMDGFEATAQIRQWEVMHAKRAIPIIAITADAYHEDRLRCLRAGMNGFLPKPVQFDQLIECVKALLPAPKKDDEQTESVDSITDSASTAASKDKT